MEELFDIYRRNFPDNVRAEDTARKILSDPENHVIDRRDARGRLAAVSVINGSTVIMLCVDAEHRGKGIGSELLRASEEYVRSAGYDVINIGAGRSYLMPGVPIGAADGFFMRRGYAHSWGDTECFDMALDMADVDYDDAPGETVRGIAYRWAVADDMDEIRECVSLAEPKFVKYYMNESLYEANGAERVLVAEENGLICGALIVSLGLELEGTGSIGCTAVRPDRQQRGIATHMVRICAGYLKAAGARRGFLGYTYSGLDRLYGRAGYRVTRRYMMAEKTLSEQGGGAQNDA